ncbi:MAG: ABC transporter permease [Armatimonadota bacterium]
MNFLRAIQAALFNLRTNKLRTALTMLGIIIGVSTVIIMVSIVEGARYAIVQEFERLGSDLIIIVYDPDREEQRGEFRRLDSMTMDDVRAIEAECALLKNISAEMPLGDNALARYRDREMEVSPAGVQPDYLHIRNFTLARGRSLTQQDLDSWNKVCVLGDEIRKELFRGEDPLGQELEVSGITLQVVGILEPKGKSGLGGGTQDDRRVLLPITTVHKRFLGSEAVGVVLAQPRDAGVLNAALDEVWECLMRRHDNTPGFRVDSQENLLQSIGRVLNMFGLVLGSIAGMALLVGGIGIMNIMLVSVTERTREIGIRKAVGAKRRDILSQFLVESATVSGVGGLLGIGIGAGAAWIVGAVTRRLMETGTAGQPGIAVHLPLWAVLGAFAFSAFIGVFFGIYPAMRAARLDPIEALRHE